VSTPALTALLALQDVDGSLDRLRHRRAHLPERAALEALAVRRAETQGHRDVAAAARDEVAGREQALEDELRTTEARAGEVDRRLYGGQVSASRDLQAMAGDVASLRARASDLEDRALEVLEEREPLDAEVGRLDGELEQLDAESAALAVRLAEAETVVSGEISSAEALRAEAVTAVSDELLAEYERLRARLGGVAVARLVGTRCDGCHLTLPATELDEIRRQPADAVVHCDNCGRILIRP
jgi:predicted  nucleic acid-binding Zn-ribbon protein